MVRNRVRLNFYQNILFFECQKWRQMFEPVKLSDVIFDPFSTHWNIFKKTILLNFRQIYFIRRQFPPLKAMLCRLLDFNQERQNSKPVPGGRFFSANVSVTVTDWLTVKYFRITIPDGYPSIPPIIQNESDITEDKSDGMEMAEYDEDEDFLKVQEQYFDERLDSLGPDLGKFRNHADLLPLTLISKSWKNHPEIFPKF